jgi:hypothetical protein
MVSMVDHLAPDIVMVWSAANDRYGSIKMRGPVALSSTTIWTF